MFTEYTGSITGACRVENEDSTDILFTAVQSNRQLPPENGAINMRKLAVALCLFLSVYADAGKSRKDIPPAPLPLVVVNAKKVFLTNGGGSDLAYDTFYSEMKNWGKYQIVGSPDDADLIVEISYHVEHGGTRVWSTNNTYNGTTQVHSTQIIDPQLVLTIYDAKTKNSLWETIDHRRLARREKNREKETINSAQRLVEELKTRASLPQ